MDRRHRRRLSNLGMIESFNFHTNNRLVEINSPVEISLKDISLGGLGIKSNCFFENDTTLSLDIQFNEENHVVIGKVVWCRKSGNFYDCGLKLIYMPEPLINFLMEIDEDEEVKYMN
ncbi:PilZ domain-containing protein [Fusibacter ferrireducens]|uniref:PilZ domain-containing protein n=1 Tax=Fusibacter ferrireducens TaxID=2785058 RepID=A0ABR9ZV46_9FIRM|nr:PilZ domain-containing protein [Fusibacter ferrireducens]MBF4694038.1 PilZ domain-containing protein [Fusibacter ferrireducens]